MSLIGSSWKEGETPEEGFEFNMHKHWKEDDTNEPSTARYVGSMNVADNGNKKEIDLTDFDSEQENDYIFSYEEYGGMKWSVETTWKKSINMCFQLTEQLSKKWTRRENATDMEIAYNGCGIYSDIYNEGAIQLMKKKV